MVEIQDAITILEENCTQLAPQNKPLTQVSQCVLAEDIFSPINMPHFRQSAMDGFAICRNDELVYQIIGEIKAGDANTITLKPGQCVKIFTGAPVPDQADAVIEIENVAIKNQFIELENDIKEGTNIRPIGEQIKQGDLALPKNTYLNAAGIGFLTSLGIDAVSVYPKPRIGIVLTGNELAKAGNQLQFGQVYESNGIMLQTALSESYYNDVTVYHVEDDFQSTKNTIDDAINQNDFVIISGGSAEGDYDFVSRATQELEVEKLFYKVNQKPGKPLYAGRKGNKMIFGLPGNPAACLTCFYIYVLPSLDTLTHKTNLNQKTIQLPIDQDLYVNNSRNQFLKAFVSDGKVSVLSHQNSSMLNSFAHANAFIYMESGDYLIAKDELVTVYTIPNSLTN